MMQQLGTSSLLLSREVSDLCPTDDVTAAQEKLKAAATELRAAQQRRWQTTGHGGVKVPSRKLRRSNSCSDLTLRYKKASAREASVEREASSRTLGSIREGSRLHVSSHRLVRTASNQNLFVR